MKIHVITILWMQGFACYLQHIYLYIQGYLHTRVKVVRDKIAVY